MARRSRRDAPDPEDYLPEEEEFDEEEEEEERPRSRRRRPREEDADEEERSPRRRRSRDKDEDEDEEEEERPRRRRRARDEEDEEEEEPRRSRRRARDEDEEEEDEDEEEERPRRRAAKKDRGGKKEKSKSRTSNRNAGWSGYDGVKSQSSSYADKLAITKIKGEALVKFLDAAPFDSYGLHWFDELEGKKGWICLRSIGEDDCPGCDTGDRASPNALFNVLVLDDDGDWNLKVIAAGTRLTGQLQGLSDGKGGLTGPYWSVMAGPPGSGTGNFQRVKERDLEEDWDINPLEEDEIESWLEDAHVLTDVENIPSYKEFKEAVRDLNE